MMSRKRVSLVTAIVLLMFLMICPPAVYAADASENAAQTAEQTKQQKKKKTGFVKAGKYTYYYNKKGKKVTGLKKLIGKDGKKHWYLFEKKTGRMLKGLQYYQKKNLVLYFNKNGEMVTGKHKVRGKTVRFDKKTGALKGVSKKVDKKANKQLDQVDRKLKAAYEWSKNFPYVHFLEDQHTSISYYANFGFDHGYGNCYVKAATFAAMARQLGYQVRQMGGYVFNIYGGKEAHSWCEIYYKGKWQICDPSFGRRGNGWMIYYGKPGTWHYTDYIKMGN